MPEFKALSQALQGQLVQWRRWFHQHPGIGFDVQETADYILKKLADWGIEAEAGVGGTGVVAVIRAASPARPLPSG